MLHTLSGFDEHLVARLSPEGARNLRVANLWALAGIVGCGVSAALLVFYCGGGLLSAAVGAVTVTVIMCGLQVYGNGTVNLSPIREVEGRWSLHSTARALLAAVLTLICLVFTQPFLLPWAAATSQGDLPTEAGIRKDLEAAARQRQMDRLQQDIALVQAQADRLGVSLAPPAAIDSLEPAQRAALQIPLAKRRALVIGNNAYERFQPLEGAVNDATSMKDVLAQLGFEVSLLTNASRLAMEAGIEAYARSLQPGDISLFHYSGHGFQARGSNYLVPIDYEADPNAVPPAAPAVNLIIESIDKRRPLANIVILDACRENLAGAAKQGLAALEAGVNTYIAFAAGPGQLATEARTTGGQSHGLFTAAIVRHLVKGGEVDQVFRSVRSEVAAVSRKIRPNGPPQETWTQHNLTAPLMLAASAPVSLRNANERWKAGADGPAGGEDMAKWYPALTLSSGAKVCDVATPSVAGLREELSFNYRKCLAGHLLRLRDGLHEVQQELAPNKDAAAVSASGARPEVSRRAMMAFRNLWTNPLVPALFSAALLFVMAGGMIWRARLNTLIDAYAIELHRENRASVIEVANRSWTLAKAFLYSPGEEHLRKRILERLGAEASQEPTSSSEDALMEFLGEVSSGATTQAAG